VDDLVYEDLSDPLPARRRLDWLARSCEFRPQPFRQLAEFYRSSGWPPDRPTSQRTGQHRCPPTGGLHFNPVVYALDLLVPLISLGQTNDWNPTGGSLAVAYALIISGWILIAALVAGVTRVLNRT